MSKEEDLGKMKKIITCYVIDVQVAMNEEFIQHEAEYLGRFIVASNDLNIGAERYHRSKSKYGVKCPNADCKYGSDQRKDY
ncbi:MAG: hypothetical protein Q8J68_06215 [Methanolobus sp.]|uniref:hypothetical protein n=1 Tax=Methanolobus sp. TaxID=1874737 RepID=UPI0027312B04|nr:hypothetical protein [Methanolobus sp.]MDP2216863.1 hypothetical protein [Methanolobus sp.]